MMDTFKKVALGVGIGLALSAYVQHGELFLHFVFLNCIVLTLRAF